MSRTTPVRPRPEDALLRRFRATGDPVALGDLFDAAAPTLFRIAVALAPHPAAAEDALQETFLAVLDGPEAYDPARPALPWLVGVLRNRIREGRQRERRLPDPRRLEPPVPLREPVGEAERAERQERVRRALVSLPAPYREVALLRWRYGLEPSEIAEVKGIPPGTVGSLLSRAKERLRRTLAGLASLLVFGPGREGRGLTAVREAILRRASRPAKAAGWVGIGLLGGALVTKKAVAVVAAAVLAIAAAGMWAIGGKESPPEAPASTPVGRIDSPPSPGTPPPAPAAAPAPGEKIGGSAVRLPSPTSLRVAVRTVSDEPLVGATVEVHPWEPPAVMGAWDILEHLGEAPVPFATARTGEDGTTVLTARFPGLTWTVRAFAEGYSRESTSRTLVPGSAAEPVVLHLRRGYALEGRVLDPEGRPLPGAVVQGGEDRFSRSVADDEGRYRLEGLPWGVLPIRAERPGGLPRPVTGVRIPDVERYDIILPPLAALAGTVTDAETGSPLEGVLVRAGLWWGNQGAGQARTDASGRYRIETLPGGVVNHVAAEIEGYVSPPPPPGPYGVNLGIRPGETTEHDIAMIPSGALEGTVLGPDGPVAGAMVYAAAGGGTRRRSFLTDGEGRYSFPGVEPGNVQVFAEKMGFHDPAWLEALATRDFTPFEVLVEARKATRRDLHLVRGRSVRGRVESAEGAPLAGARIGGHVTFGPAAVTGPDGRFTVTGLGPDPVQSAVTRPGFVPATLEIPGEAAATPGEDLVVRLEPASRVSGTVLAEGGAAPEEAFVKAFVITGRTVPGTGVAETLWTDPAPVAPDGGYAIDLPWGGSGRFRVHAEGLGFLPTAGEDVPFEPGRRAYSVDVVLRRGASLAGTVVERMSGAALPGVRVAASGTLVAVTGGEGRFRVANADVVEGTVALAFHADGFVAVHGKLDPDAPGEARIAMDRDCPIEGTIRMPDGSLAGRAIVDAKGPASNRVISADGRFRIGDLPPGEYTLEVQPFPPDATFLPAALDRVQAGATEVIVNVQPPVEGGTLSGRVVDGEGKPLAGIVVRALTGVKGAVPTGAVTEADGTYSFRPPGPGPFTVVANPASSNIGPYAKGTDLTTVTREGVLQDTAGLEFVLRRGLVLTGTLCDENGAPLASALLSSAGRIAVTTAKGEFAFHGLDPGDVRILLVAPRDRTLRDPTALHAAGTEGVRLVAERRR